MPNELLNLNTETLEPNVTFKLGSYEFKNKDQLQEFLKGAEKYNGLIVTNDDDYKSGKKLRADLRKVSEVINRHRIDKKAEMIKPIEEFESEMKELDSIVQGVVKDIDKSVKAFEQKERDDKQVIIDELYKEFGEGYPIEEQKSWYNRTKKVDDIRREMLELVEEAKQAEKRREEELKHIEQACKVNNLTSGGYITLLEIGHDVLEIIQQINQDGERKRELEKQQEEYNAQQVEQVTEVTEVKEEPKIDDPVISQVIEMQATPSQFQELIQEMKRIGVKFVRVVDLNEGQVKAN